MDGELTMESVYRGLAAPRQVIPIGRDDIPTEDRPGALLAGMAREALGRGAFPDEPDHALVETLPPPKGSDPFRDPDEELDVEAAEAAAREADVIAEDAPEA
jgi:hypothetical protein